MIPALIAVIVLGILLCMGGIYNLRADLRGVRVPKLPAKWRRRRGRHRKSWWRRSTMERWSLLIQRARELADIYVEPDWMDDLRAQWTFGDVDEFDTVPVGGAAGYTRLRPDALESTHEQFLAIVGPSVWGTPVDVDEWEPVEPQLVVTR